MKGVQIWCGFAKYLFLGGAAGSFSKHNLWMALSNRLRNLYTKSSRRELLIDICMGIIEGGKGGGVWGVFKFFGPPSKNLLGHSNEVSNISLESSAQSQSIGLFGQIGLRVGSVDMSKSQRHTRSGAGRGVSQADGAAIHPKLTGLCQHEIVSGVLKKWKQCGTVQASYGCLVGHVCMGVRTSVFAP